MADLRESDKEWVVFRLRSYGLEQLNRQITLKSGRKSNCFVDAKKAFSDSNYANLIRLFVELVDVKYTTTGGPTMGADFIAHGIALMTSKRWFTVRKDPKEHGLGELRVGPRSYIEGCMLGSGDNILMVDDVISTGSSVLEAIDKVEQLGAKVAAVATVLDRGDEARPLIAARGIPYFPLVTYCDLQIAPVSETSTTVEETPSKTPSHSME